MGTQPIVSRDIRYRLVVHQYNYYLHLELNPLGHRTGALRRRPRRFRPLAYNRHNRTPEEHDHYRIPFSSTTRSLGARSDLMSRALAISRHQSTSLRAEFAQGRLEDPRESSHQYSESTLRFTGQLIPVLVLLQCPVLMDFTRHYFQKKPFSDVIQMERRSLAGPAQHNDQRENSQVSSYRCSPYMD